MLRIRHLRFLVYRLGNLLHRIICGNDLRLLRQMPQKHPCRGFSVVKACGPFLLPQCWVLYFLSRPRTRPFRRHRRHLVQPHYMEKYKSLTFKRCVRLDVR